MGEPIFQEGFDHEAFTQLNCETGTIVLSKFF